MVFLVHAKMGFLKYAAKIETIMSIWQGDTIHYHILTNERDIALFVQVVCLGKVNPLQTNGEAQQVSK